jgi:lysophospholipase L1-like esterase
VNLIGRNGYDGTNLEPHPGAVVSRPRQVLFAVLPLLVGLLLVEALVRAMDPDLSLPGDPRRFRFDQTTAATHPHHVRDDELGWRLRPDQRSPIVTNARGYRTPPFTEEPARGTIRVVFLGDSNPMGFGLSDEDAAYPRRVEQILEEMMGWPADGVECVNLAVDGYSSEQVRTLFDEEVPALDPDVVVVQAGFNDHCRVAVPDHLHRYDRPVVLDLLETSHAYRWLRRQILRGSPDRGRDGPPVPRVALDRFEANLRHVTRAAMERGAEVFLVTTPARPTVPLVINEVRLAGPEGPRWISQQRWIEERLAAAGVVPPDSPTDPRYLEVVTAALREHPDWAILPYLVARALDAQGREAEAVPFDARWRALDRDREALDAYNQRIRRVAADEEAVLIDVRPLLDRAARELDQAPPLDAFLDFVHLDGRGHVVVATEIARHLAPRSDEPR